jgi:hypothetical protein
MRHVRSLTYHVSSLSRVMFVRSRVPDRHRHARQLTGKKNPTNRTGYRIAQHKQKIYTTAYITFRDIHYVLVEHSVRHIHDFLTNLMSYVEISCVTTLCSFTLHKEQHQKYSRSLTRASKRRPGATIKLFLLSVYDPTFLNYQRIQVQFMKI